ncbi:UNVERIFIED_CONTAM: hypothetical protein FKN15_041972 [Acipenser sinensis]
MDKKQLRKRYLKGWFTVDLFAIFPFEIVYLTYPKHDIWIMLSYCRLNRILKVVRLFSFISSLAKEPELNKVHVAALNYFCIIVIFIHSTACVWYGDIHSLTLLETVYSVIIMFTALGVLVGVIMTGMSSIITNLDARRGRFCHRLYSIKLNMKDIGLPPEVQTWVEKYYVYLWKHRKGTIIAGLLDDLPFSIHSEISLACNQILLKKSTLFRGTDEGFKRALSVSINPYTYSAGQILVKRGESNQSMYYLEHGLVQIYLMYKIPRNVTICAATLCEIYVLHQKDLLNLFADFPEGNQSDFKSIYKNYQCTWNLYYDVAAVLPTDLFTFVEEEHLRWPYLGLFRMNRLLWLRKVYLFYVKRENDLEKNLLQYRASKCVFMLMFSIHTCAGLFYLAGCFKQKCDPGSWADKYGFTKYDPDIEHYITAVYWAGTTMTTTGYGDITGSTAIERIICIFVSIIGAFVFNYIVSQIGATLASTNASRVGFQNRLVAMTFFMESHDLSQSLQQRVIQYMSLLWEKYHGQAYPGGPFLMHDLPTELQQIVLLKERGKLLSKAGFLFGKPATMTLRAKTYCEVLVINFDKSHKVFDKYPAIRRSAILPSNRLYIRWEIFRIFLALTVSILTSTLFSFLHHKRELWFACYILGGFCWLDMYVRLHVAFYKDNKLNVDTLETARHYVRTSFLLDLVSCFPFEVFAWAVVSPFDEAGSLYFGWMVGTVTSILANADAARAVYTEKLESIKHFLKSQKITGPIADSVQKFYSFKWIKTKGVDPETLFEYLPSSLLGDISTIIYSDVIAKGPIFEKTLSKESLEKLETDGGFIRMLATKIRPCVFRANDFICKRNDYGSEMFFIEKGEVDVLSQDERSVMVTLKAGQYFGEGSLLFSEPRSTSIRASTNCDMYVLDKKDLDSTVKYYPDICKEIRDSAIAKREQLLKLKAQQLLISKMDTVKNDKFDAGFNQMYLKYMAEQELKLKYVALPLIVRMRTAFCQFYNDSLKKIIQLHNMTIDPEKTLRIILQYTSCLFIIISFWTITYMVKWMMYWIVFAFFTTAETLTDIILSWFPFYFELKIAFVIWLLSPYTKGSSVLYRKFVHPTLSNKEKEIDEYITQARDRSYDTMMTFGKRGLNLAANAAVTAAAKGQGVLSDKLFSFSMQDLTLIHDEETVHLRSSDPPMHTSASSLLETMADSRGGGSAGQGKAQPEELHHSPKLDGDQSDTRTEQSDEDAADRAPKRTQSVKTVKKTTTKTEVLNMQAGRSPLQTTSNIYNVHTNLQSTGCEQKHCSKPYLLDITIISLVSDFPV